MWKWHPNVPHDLEKLLFDSCESGRKNLFCAIDTVRELSEPAVSDIELDFHPDNSLAVFFHKPVHLDEVAVEGNNVLAMLLEFGHDTSMLLGDVTHVSLDSLQS